MESSNTGLNFLLSRPSGFLLSRRTCLSVVKFDLLMKYEPKRHLVRFIFLPDLELINGYGGSVKIIDSVSF